MLVQVPVMFQLNQSTLNKLYFLFFSLFFLQSCNENHEDKNLPIHKEWIYDFNAETLDTNVWNIVKGNGCPQLCGFGNNELQHYTNSEENLHIKNGQLVISATYDSVFKSAKLTSENYIDFQTGSVEVSAKLPSARGTWPAIWLLPSLERPLNWPLDGEIDIMENVGYNPNYIFGTIHTAAYNHTKGTHLTDSIFIDDLDQNFHSYKLVWTDSTLAWFVDGIQFHFLSKSEHDTENEWPFDKPFHLILNLAVGGDWGGKMGVDTNAFPQDFFIDYIKIKSPS